MRDTEAPNVDPGAGPEINPPDGRKAERGAEVETDHPGAFIPGRIDVLGQKRKNKLPCWRSLSRADLLFAGEETMGGEKLIRFRYT